MTRSRHSFPPEFKTRAVRIVVETHRSVASVARELNMHEQTLRNWVNRYRREHSLPLPPSVPRPVITERPKAQTGPPPQHPQPRDADRRERDLLASAARMLTVEQRYEFIDAHLLTSTDDTATFPVATMCAWLGVSHEGYERWRSRASGPAETTATPRRQTHSTAAPAGRDPRNQRRRRRGIRGVIVAAAVLAVVVVGGLLGFSSVASDTTHFELTPVVATNPDHTTPTPSTTPGRDPVPFAYPRSGPHLGGGAFHLR